jgi:hypothetical protein
MGNALLAGKSEERKQLGRSRWRWDHKIELDRDEFMRLRICDTMTYIYTLLIIQRLPTAADGNCVSERLWPGPRRRQWSILVARKMVFGFHKRQWTDWLVEQSSASHAVLCSSLAPHCVSGLSPRCCFTVCVCGPRQQVALLAHSVQCGGYRKHWHYLSYI